MDAAEAREVGSGERDKELSFSHIELGPYTLDYMYGEV